MDTTKPKIVALAAHTCEAQAVADVVEILEDALARERAGELISVSIAAVTRRHTTWAMAHGAISPP